MGMSHSINCLDWGGEEWHRPYAVTPTHTHQNEYVYSSFCRLDCDVLFEWIFDDRMLERILKCVWRYTKILFYIFLHGWGECLYLMCWQICFLWECLCKWSAEGAALYECYVICLYRNAFKDLLCLFSFCLTLLFFSFSLLQWIN